MVMAMADIDASQPLANHQHEKFAQALVTGNSQTEAYRQAGYEPENAAQNASRLLTNDNIKRRVVHLQGVAAQAAAITTAAQALRLKDLSKLHEELVRGGLAKSVAGAVSAESEVNKLLGLHGPSRVAIGADPDAPALNADLTTHLEAIAAAKAAEVVDDGTDD